MADQQYLAAVKEVLEKGTRKPNRTGVDTISTFNINYEIDLANGFPLLTTKKIAWKNIVLENLWFLSGRTHIGLLKKHKIKFWDEWADQDGFVPSAYGNFWRNFPTSQDGDSLEFKDQINFIVDELKTNPMSRRLVVSAWSPGNAHHSALPPCHCMFIFNVQNDGPDGQPRLNLHLTQRSCDIALGVPYNIAGYSFILSLVAHLTGLQPGIFAHTLIDAHIYTSKSDGSMSEYDHIPGLREQLTRQPRQLPTLSISDDISSLQDVEQLIDKDLGDIMCNFTLNGYNPHEFIKFKVAV